MTTLPASIQNSSWQTERQTILHRACQRIKTTIARGGQVQKTIRSTSRRFNGRAFKCDPSRRLALSVPTLRRVWDAWKRGGEVPEAITLNFNPHRRFIPVPVLIRFANFICTGKPQRSLAAAWRKFSRCKGSFGHGRPLKISDYLLRKHFSTARFYRIKAGLKSIQTAQASLALEVRETITDFRRRNMTP